MDLRSRDDVMHKICRERELERDCYGEWRIAKYYCREEERKKDMLKNQYS